MTGRITSAGGMGHGKGFAMLRAADRAVDALRAARRPGLCRCARQMVSPTAAGVSFPIPAAHGSAGRGDAPDHGPQPWAAVSQFSCRCDGHHSGADGGSSGQ